MAPPSIEARACWCQTSRWLVDISSTLASSDRPVACCQPEATEQQQLDCKDVLCCSWTNPVGIDPNICWPVCQHVCVEISEKTASYERRCEAVHADIGGQHHLMGSPTLTQQFPCLCAMHRPIYGSLSVYMYFINASVSPHFIPRNNCSLVFRSDQLTVQ